jgi:hypothetical protein
MSKRKRGSTGRLTPSAQAREWLRGDYPVEVKQALLLSYRGGRQRPRHCLACGAPARHLDVYVSYKVMTVGGDVEGRGCTMYWTCEGCHLVGLTPELEAKFKEGQR